MTWSLQERSGTSEPRQCGRTNLPWCRHTRRRTDWQNSLRCKYVPSLTLPPPTVFSGLLTREKNRYNLLSDEAAPFLDLTDRKNDEFVYIYWVEDSLEAQWGQYHTLFVFLYNWRCKTSLRILILKHDISHVKIFWCDKILSLVQKDDIEPSASNYRRLVCPIKSPAHEMWSRVKPLTFKIYNWDILFSCFQTAWQAMDGVYLTCESGIAKRHVCSTQWSGRYMYVVTVGQLQVW